MTTATLTKTGLRAGAGDVRPGAGGTVAGSRRWLALVFVSMAQMMVALDATVINIALPSAQRALHISDADRAWVVTAYTLAFGGLLLVGGRVADALGRRRAFVVGLAGFAAASAAGGAATGFTALVVARGAQGAFAAVLAPTALSVLAVTFTEPKERAKAFAVFGAIAGTGGAIGLLLGGVLTEYVEWRWCLFVNVLIALAALVGSLAVLGDGPAVPGRKRFDAAGATLATTGLVAVVYGLSQAASKGWASTSFVAPAVVGAGLLVAFLAVESRVGQPLLPLHILRDRDRAGIYLAIALTVLGMYGLFLLLTYDFQVVLGYSPARAGAAFLPLSAAVMSSSTVLARRLLPRVAPRALVVPGLVLAAAGMATLTRLHADSGYAAHVLPAELLIGLGMGLVFVPAFSTATAGVAPRDAGVASAMVNTAQQIGASLGTALLNTVAAGATASYLAVHAGGGPTRAHVAAALVHGYATAAGWAAGILLAAALAAGMLITADAPATPPVGR